MFWYCQDLKMHWWETKLVICLLFLLENTTTVSTKVQIQFLSSSLTFNKKTNMPNTLLPLHCAEEVRVVNSVLVSVVKVRLKYVHV